VAPERSDRQYVVVRSVCHVHRPVALILLSNLWLARVFLGPL
jgi:hypothetical protein